MKIISSSGGLFSPEFYKKKQKAKHLKLAVGVSVFIAFVITVILFFRWEKFLISEVVIAEDIMVDRSEVKQSVEQELEGYYFYLIPKSNAFIYKLNNPKDRLLGKFPRFTFLNLDLEGFQKLVVSASEREPFALYCVEVENCFFLDESGFIFAKAPLFSEGVYFIYKDDEPLTEPIGQRFLLENPARTTDIVQSGGEFRGLQKFLDNLPHLGINVHTLEMGSNEYRAVLESGAKILWKMEAEPGLIYSNLEAFLSNEAIISEKDFLEKIEHLDLRTEDKVFWKFK